MKNYIFPSSLLEKYEIGEALEPQYPDAFTQMDVFPSDSGSVMVHRTEKCHSQPWNLFSNLKIRRKKHRYRALCKKRDSLLIAESVNFCTYSEFVSSLSENGIENAIYLDCGFGWSYGWYRINSESVKLLHWIKPPYISNWLVFRKY